MFAMWPFLSKAGINRKKNKKTCLFTKYKKGFCSKIILVKSTKKLNINYYF